MKFSKKKKKKLQKSIEKPRRMTGFKFWLAVGAMGAFTLPGFMATPAYANPINRTTFNYQAAAQNEQATYRFDIAPASIDVVIKDFQRITGLQVELSNEAMRELASPGVVGNFSAE